MDEQNPISPSQQALRILDYWHKVEFFESTDIKDLEDNAEGVIQLNMDELHIGTSLPWIEPKQIRRAGLNYSPETKYRFELFFGIFDRDEIFQHAKPYLDSSNVIDDEVLGNEGRTCSIKCKIDHNGILDSESFEFSTVTWALGKLARGGLDQLNFDAYENDTIKLKQRFKEILAVADNIKKQHNQPIVLTSSEIIAFLKAMAQWTDFTPNIPTPALFIKLCEANKSDTSTPFNPAALLDLSTLTEQALLNPPDHSPALSAFSTNEISILNSFYLRDIERVIDDIKKNKFDENSPLGRYLTGSHERKADLLLPEGRPLLIENLRLSKLPAGRWLSDSQHNMSLMQQFAINTLEQELANSGLYSVNGPPGTGKTTLLRDVIANNLVKRAAILARLDQVEDAFSGSLTISVNRETRKIPFLRSELCGFEMVVVSSNNAAVENISRELPQLKSLGDEWQHHDYFKSAARKLAASTRPLKKSESKAEPDKTYFIKPLTPEEDCWGLIAVALGKKKNRDRFKERVFTYSHTKAVTSAPGDEYRHLFESIKNKNIESFSCARQAFMAAQQNYQVIFNELQQLESLNDFNILLQQKQHKLESFKLRTLTLNARIERRIKYLPRWRTLKFGKIFREKAIATGLKLRLSSSNADLQLAELRVNQMIAEQDEKQRNCSAFTEKYKDVIFAKATIDLEAEDVQRTTFGHGLVLNAARSQLSACALNLHQAWFKEAYNKCELLKVLFSVSTAINGGISEKRACLALWQLLFMIVPVVSSTFASVHRQFAQFSAGDIGWLFIDEAGQATPQQAAGALWRAKRTVVVGDPLQIEPVFTVPPAFVEALAQRAFADDWRQWSPTTQSVQNLADRVNPFGSAQISKDNWLGSPLRVHRRCDEPMFSIANTIAYNSKMLHGRDKRWPVDNTLWGESRWLDVCGEVRGKHYVAKQGEKVLEMIQDWYKHHNILPDVYIISPFKQIKNQLKLLLNRELQGIKNISRWLDDRVGTVHTFQGKEEKNVIIVLGLSTDHCGGEKWASAKPNLLNVAVTRAQKRVYIIGSKAVWAGCDYFNVANEMLSNAAPPLNSACSTVVQTD